MVGNSHLILLLYKDGKILGSEKTLSEIMRKSCRRILHVM